MKKLKTLITLGILLVTALSYVTEIHAEEYYFVENGIRYFTAVGAETCMVVENPETPYSGVIDIPETAGGYRVDEIASFAFKRCNNLTEVRVGSNVTKLGDLAFWNCRSLEKVVLPETLEDFGWRVFLGCRALKEVNLPEGITWIFTETFKGCISLEEIVIPESVEYIDIEAFWGSGVRNINLPDNVVEIRADAFSESGLESIHIGKGLERIKTGVFNGCLALREVYITAPEPPEYITYPAYVGGEELGDVILYVPQASIEKYKETEYWGMFKEIRAIETAGIQDEEMNQEKPETIYDLQGRRLRHTVPGINIVNGKKIMTR